MLSTMINQAEVIKELNELITYWTDKPASKQRTTVLRCYLKQLDKYTSYNLKVMGNYGTKWISNSTKTKDSAIAVLAKFFKQPKKKAHENRDEQVYRFYKLVKAF